MSILKVWQLTLIWQNKMPWWEVGKKKGLFNPLLMRKHDFWHVQWFLNGQKWGLKKASLYVHFEGLTTDSYFGKTRCPGGGWIEKRLFNPLLMRKHDFWHVQWFLNGQKWEVKKKHLCMSILKVWQLTLILAKQDALGGGWIEKRLFNPLLMRKHDFWHVQWFLNGQKWEVKKKHLCMSILKVWQLTLIWQNKMPWGEVG